MRALYIGGWYVAVRLYDIPADCPHLSSSWGSTRPGETFDQLVQRYFGTGVDEGFLRRHFDTLGEDLPAWRGYVGPDRPDRLFTSETSVTAMLTQDFLDYGGVLSTDAPPASRSPDFPHVCPRPGCGRPAYVGFTRIECSRKDCRP